MNAVPKTSQLEAWLTSIRRLNLPQFSEEPINWNLHVKLICRTPLQRTYADGPRGVSHWHNEDTEEPLRVLNGSTLRKYQEKTNSLWGYRPEIEPSLPVAELLALEDLACQVKPSHIVGLPLPLWSELYPTQKLPTVGKSLPLSETEALSPSLRYVLTLTEKEDGLWARFANTFGGLRPRKICRELRFDRWQLPYLRQEDQEGHNMPEVKRGQNPDALFAPDMKKDSVARNYGVRTERSVQKGDCLYEAVPLPSWPIDDPEADKTAEMLPSEDEEQPMQSPEDPTWQALRLREGKYERESKKRESKKHLGKLTDAEIEVLSLKIMKQMTWEQIAEVTGLSRSTVARRFASAKAKRLPLSA